MARRALGPASLDLAAAVAAVCRRDRPWLVGCSGGADSLALTAIADHVARRSGTTAQAVIVDHGLQPGSADVAADVAGRLGERGIVAAVVDVAVASVGGPEAAARDARLAALHAAAATDGADILLAHTLDDQAESVLLGLARGAGARSLAGMAPRRDGVVRPLLTVRRATTEQACRELGLRWWDDPHNSDPRFARSRIRAGSLPQLERDLGPGVAEALARTARLLRDDADLLDELAAALVDPTVPELDCGSLADRPPALRRRALRVWLLAHGATECTEAHLLPVDRLITDWHGQGPIQLPGLVVTRSHASLVAEPAS